MQEEGINLYKLVKFYLQHWLVLLGGVVFGVLIGVLYYQFFCTPLYKSETKMILADHRSTQDTTMINNYIEIMKSRKVLEPVLEKTGVGQTYDSLVKHIEVNNNGKTEVIALAVSLPDARESQIVAGAMVESFRTETRSIYGMDESAEVIIVVDEASLPTVAYGTSIAKAMVVAGALALAAMLVMMLIAYDYGLSKASAVGEIVEEAQGKPAAVVEIVEEVKSEPIVAAPEVSGEVREASETPRINVKQRRYARDMPSMLTGNAIYR